MQGLKRNSMLAEMIPEMFEADTHDISTVNTRAAAKIWQNTDQFLAIANDLVNGSNDAIEIVSLQGETGLIQALDKIRPHCG